MSPTNKLAIWFALKWDGSAQDFDRDMKEEAQELYHPNLAIATASGTVDFEATMRSHRENVKRGLVCSNIEKLVAVSKDKVEYKVELTYKDDGTRLTLHSIGTFQDGKLIRVDPFTKEGYDKVFVGAK